ncbi:MAG TPA: molecular chaperone [Croceibacterium sp.]|nr:molecular chaperone [Croceibacterium sp.]
MRTFAILAATAALLIPATASAQAALRVQPLSVEVDSPSQASSLTLQNNGSETISLQLRVFEWTQEGGQDRLTPTTEVVASPPVARIAPGSNYTIRLARTVGAAAPGTEEAYRLWVDELPPASLERVEGGTVDVRLRFDLPVFFRGQGARPSVSWDARPDGDRVVVEGTNSGSAHARIEGLAVRAGASEVSFGAGLNGYVLGRSSRRWTAPAGSAEVLAAGNATVVTGAGGDDNRQTVALAD